MRTINKLTKLVLSFLLVITCINFSVVQAEDGSDENYSEPTAVETISEEPVAEEPAVEEAAPVEEPQQEEVAPEASEETQVEEATATPEEAAIEEATEAAEPQQEETVEPEVQQEAPVEPEVQKVETVEEVKVTVVVSYVDESDRPLTDPITGSYPIEYRLDENVDAFKSFDGYDFEKMIVNDDAKNTISKDDVQKNGLRITKDMTSLKLVYQKMNLEFNESKEVIPEVTEETAEEAEPESNTNETELSAFDQTAFAGKVGVHASAAEGVLPKGARLIVEQVNRKAILNAVENTVSDNNKEMDSAVALDISIVDKDGNKIQPNGIVNITFVNTGVSGDEVKIYHVEDDASAVTEIANNTDSFDASHFSIYVITGEKNVPLATYTFIANGSVVSTQIVKSGDTLIAPTAPDVDGQAFVGWVDEAGNPFTGFGKQPEITETTTPTITARYEAALYVYFLNPDGSQIMRTEKVGDHKAHDFTTVSYEVDPTHKLVGWAKEVNGTTDIAKNITVPDESTSVNVYAIIKEGYWVSFNSDGGSIVDSQFVLHGDNLDKIPDSTKPGYTFDGWYNGSAKVENGATVTSSMTLTAHWKAAEVSYTVIHWWENADDDGYSFHESENKTGMTGKEANAKAKSYDGFTAQSVTKKTIKGDGSTIVSVYYKRNVYEVKFYSYSTGGFFEPWKPSKEYEDLRITAKYGQDISKKWPTYSGSSTWSTTDDDYNGPFQVNIATMPLGGAKFYGPKTGSGSETAYYYVEVLPGEPSEVTKDGIRYKLDHKDTSPGTGYSVSKEDQYPLTGYTFNEKVSTKTGKDYDNAKFYYTRNSYKIKFINKGEDKSVEKKYEQSISSENYTPVRPSSLPDYYEFDGWYDNELCEGEAFDFNGKKMPAQNVTLYAKWTAKKINLTYNLNNPEGDVVKGTKKVEAGTLANTVLPSASAIEGYSFAGWYVADENGHMTTVAFNANDAILRDTNVIGKWLYNGKLTVKYVADGVEAPKDNKVYAGGAKAKVANGVTKDGQKFLGWQLDGKVYQPGQNFEVNKDLADDKNVITLTAVFGDSETSAILTYHRGNGNGENQSVAILNNVEVTLKNTSDFDLIYTAPGNDYYFAGWATSMEDAQKGNAKYAVGDKVRVNADSSNDLYATWVKKTVIEVTANSNTLPYNGEVQKVEGFKDVTAGYEVTGLTAVAEGKDFGTYKTNITGTAKVTKDGVDVTDKVIVNVNKGTLAISKREVTLTSQTDSKDYDGTPLTRPDVTITGEFVKDEVSDIKATGSVTNVSEGKVTNTITYKTSDKFNPDNYTIVKEEGKLSIDASTEKVTVNIKEHSGTFTYDSNKKTVEGYDVKSISNPLYTAEDFRFNGTAKVSGTNAGTYDMEINVADFENTNTNFANVEFVIAEEGQLVIDKRSVTLESDTKSKPYDGTPLTRPDVKMTGSFVNGEVSDVRATGSVTNVSEGNVTNTITYKTSDKFNTDNYTIVVKEGKLSITPATDNVLVEIKGKTKTVTYNGNTHEVEGYKYTNISNALYPEEAIHFEGTAKASRKEEGTSYMGLNATQFSNTSANFTNVTFRVTDGWLKVDPKSIDPEDEKTGIQVTKPSDTMYNGEEQKNKPTVEDTKTGATLVENVDYTLSYTAAVNAGTVEVTITGIGNYTGTAKTSYEITKRNVTLTSASASKPYDKTPLTNKNVTIAGFGFVKDEGATYNVTGSQTEKGTSKNKFTYELKSNTKASNYTIEVVYGDLTVTAEDGEVVVIITGRKDTFEYDGTEKSVKGYDVSITEGSTYTESDFTFSGNDEVKGKEAGTYDMGLKPEDFTNNNENYGNVTFRVTDGQLIITPKSINPEDEKSGIEATDPADSIYNGEAHVNPLIVTDTKTGKDLVENKDYTLTYVGDVKNVGTVEVKVKGIGNYTGEFTKTYKITPREYTVTTDSAEKPYDGTALTAGGRVNNLVDGETVTLKMTGSQTEVGSSDNTYDLKWTGSAKEGNYEHGEDSIGTLTVKKQSIDPGTDPEKPNPDYTGAKVNSPKDSVYDGKEHKWTPTVSDADDKALTEGTDYTVSYDTADFTNVHTITVTIEGIGNYTGTVVRTYAITPAEVTVTANNANKVYGENDPELKATVTGTLNNDTVDYTVTRDPGEDVGKYAIHVTGDEDQGNYHVTYTAGEFEITKSGELILTAELTGESATKVYDGNPLTGGATANVKEGTTITYSTDSGATWTTEVPSITNVGTLNITAKAENPNYEPVETTYSLTVTHATVTVTAENKTKVYGTADPELTATVSGTLGNDTVAYTLAREAGENAGKYKITVTGEENQGNYKVTYTPGTFEITPKTIVPDGPETPEEKKTGIEVTEPEDSKYDGEEHKNTPTVADTKTGKTLTEGTDYTLTYSEDVTNAGKVTVTVTGIGNYTGEFDVTYEITKRDVVLTSATDSKPYDGTALRNENVEVTGDGFIEGEGAEYKVTGTQTQVGNSANEFEYTLNENTLASNYDITKVVGTLTVTAAPAPETPEKPKPEVKKSVDTSDDNNIVFYGNAFFMAMITLAGIIVLRKKSS